MDELKPLKNQVLIFKGIIVADKFVKKNDCETPLIHLEDLYFAVEWLKKTIDDTTFKTPIAVTNDNKIITVKDLVNMAFPDLSTLPKGNFANAKDYNSNYVQ